MGRRKCFIAIVRLVRLARHGGDFAAGACDPAREMVRRAGGRHSLGGQTPLDDARLARFSPPHCALRASRRCRPRSATNRSLFAETGFNGTGASRSLWRPPARPAPRLLVLMSHGWERLTLRASSATASRFRKPRLVKIFANEFERYGDPPLLVPREAGGRIVRMDGGNEARREEAAIDRRA